MSSKAQQMSHCPQLLKGDDDMDEANLSFEGKKTKLKEKNMNVLRSPQQNPTKPKITTNHKQKENQSQYNSENIYDRLNQEAEIFKQHNHQLQEYYQQEELRDCLFSPQLVAQSENQEQRTLYQFLFDQQNHVLKVEQKIQQIKQADIDRDNEHSYHPQTNEYVFQNRDDKIPIYERLYNLKKTHNANPPPPIESLQSQLQEQQQYRPQILEKSKNLVRNGKVEDLLYQDAMRRNQKQKTNKQMNETKTVTVSMKFTSSNSERIVAQKFIREFEATVDQIFDETGIERPSNISYSIDYLKLGEILQRMEFINTLVVRQNNERALEYENLRLSEERALLCEIWSILRGDELGGISKRNLCLFLLTLIGITDFKIKELPATSQPEKQDKGKGTQNHLQQNKISNGHQAKDKPKCGHLDGDGNIIFNYEETRKVQKQFDRLYRNRLGSEELKKSNWKDLNSYKPEINQNSKQLANQYREKLLEETAALWCFLKNRLIVISQRWSFRRMDKQHMQICQCFKRRLRSFNWSRRRNSRLNVNWKIAHSDRNCYKILQTIRMINRFLRQHFQLYALAKPSYNKRDRTKEEVEFERQAEDCTFQPDTVKNQSQSKQDLNSSSSYCIEIVVEIIFTFSCERYRQERFENERRKKTAREGRSKGILFNIDQLQTQLDRGYKCFQGDQLQGKQPRGSATRQKLQNSGSQEKLNTFPSQQQEIQLNDNKNYEQDENSQFSRSINEKKGIDIRDNHLNPDQERVPLLFVDVNLGPGKTERIIVFEGDQSFELATRFAQDHGKQRYLKHQLGLDEFMREKLKELLDYQISGLLTKIDEEGQSSDME